MAIPVSQISVSIHVDFLNIQGHLPCHLPDDLFHVVAETALLPRVKRDFPGHFVPTPGIVMSLCGILRALKKNSESVLNGAGVMVASSTGPWT